jgi:hypothetical protein
MVSRTSEWRSAFWATAVPAPRTTVVPKEWRVPWKVTWRGMGFAQTVGLPHWLQRSGGVAFWLRTSWWQPGACTAAASIGWRRSAPGAR